MREVKELLSKSEVDLMRTLYTIEKLLFHGKCDKMHYYSGGKLDDECVCVC